MKKYFFIGYLLLLVISCQTKEEPDRIVGTPVFSMKGTVNENPVEMVAGEDGYYMFSDFNVDSQGVVYFTGKLAQTACATCKPSLKIIISNYRQGLQYSIDSALHLGDYDFFNPNLPDSNYYEVLFTSKSKGSGTATHQWDFGNGQTSFQQDPVIRYNQSGTYNVTYTVDYGGCTSTLSQPVSMLPGNNIDFNINYISSRNLLFNRIPIDSNAAVYWDFGDGQSGNGNIVNHTYADSGIYRVCMTSFSGGVDTLHFCKNVNTSDLPVCTANFNYNCVLKNTNQNLSKIVVEWTDENGAVYTSERVSQAGAGTFTIKGVQGYTVNEKGQKTKQLNILLNCMVSDGSRMIQVKNMEGTIAVSYP